MDYKKEMKAQFKELAVEAGIFRIKHVESGNQYIGSLNNLKRLNGVTFQLNMNSFNNKALQKDWNDFGKDAFVVEIMEVLKKPETGVFILKTELEKKQQHYVEQLKPFYNQ